MTTRTRYTGSSTDVPWDDAGATEGFGNQYNRLLGVLYDHSALVLTSVGGTGDAVTASLDPVLDGGGLVDGMKFTITWGAANTGGVTLVINGGSAVPVLDAEGGALTSGRLEGGLRSLIEYVGGSFRILSGLAGGLTVLKYYQVFTASGTWTKPTDVAADALVIVEAWGGGGGGGGVGAAQGSGGGGGGYATKRFRAGDLPSSVSVAIGAGGVGRTGTAGPGTAGGNTTFGALLTAYGGGAGAQTNQGGGGGGELGAGSVSGANGPIGGGAGGSSMPGSAASTIYGGGGGGGSNGGGGAAIYGGGGGGGHAASGTAGGQSVYGGAGGGGGDPSPLPTAGTAPGGGGGGGQSANGANGARGEVRIWIP